MKYNLKWLREKIENSLDTIEVLEYLEKTEKELREKLKYYRNVNNRSGRGKYNLLLEILDEKWLPKEILGEYVP